MSRVSITALALVVIVAAIAGRTGFVEVSLDRLNPGDIGTLLLTVIFAALVIERAVEVYINNAFNPEQMRLSRGITIAQRQLEIAEEALTAETDRQTRSGTPDQKTLDALRGPVEQARQALLKARQDAIDDLADHRNRKAAWAGAVSTLLSLAAAAVGVRILGQFLPIDDNARLIGPLAQKGAEAQLAWFRAADTVLTTFVLAGGADGIHQIIKRFTNPPDTTS